MEETLDYALTFRLPPSMMRRLQEASAAAGLKPRDYARAGLIEILARGLDTSRIDPSFVNRPTRRRKEKRGVSDDG